MDRDTRLVWVRVTRRRDQHTISRCLEAFIARLKHPVHTVVTDNQGGFTDRCAGDKKGKPSGRHRFDVVCHKHGMVERFNRRLGEAIKARLAMPGHGSRKFASRDERDAFA